MDSTLRQILSRHGAVFDAVSDRVVEFGDAEAELNAAFDASALFDRSDLGRLRATGPDLLGLLHRLSTAAVLDLQPGSGKPTVLTTPKGRIVERLFVQPLEDRQVLLVGGIDCAGSVIAHLERFTFAEQTGLTDVTPETFLFSLIGPDSARALLGCVTDLPAAYGSARATIAGRSVHLLGHDGFDSLGYSVVGEIVAAADVWSVLAARLRDAGGRPGGELALESYRLLRGLPSAGHELTEEHNPLEAGLRGAVDFDKGCYVGQEVVARLNTYDKVSRSLVGLEFPPVSPLPEPGTPLLFEGRKVGVLTSAVRPPGHGTAVALGYVKQKELRPGIRLRIAADGPEATAVELPLRRPA